MWFAALYVFFGFDDIANLELSFVSLISFVLVAFCIIYYLWSRRTPYIRITTDKIVLSKFMRNSTVYNLGTIHKMNVHTWINIPYKVYLLLSDDTEEKIIHHIRLNINLLFLNEKDKEELIQILKQVTE